MEQRGMLANVNILKARHKKVDELEHAAANNMR
jgi:hypothetical protein